MLPPKSQGVRWMSWDGGMDHVPSVTRPLSRGSGARRPCPSPSAGIWRERAWSLRPRCSPGSPRVTERHVVRWEASRVAALSCRSPVTQRRGATVSRVLSEWKGQVPYATPPPPQCLRPRGRGPSSSRLRYPRPVFTGSLLVCSTFTVFLLAKIFRSRGRSHSGTADPWALLRWLRSLDADFCSEQRYSWPDMKGEILTARFLRAVYPD